MKKLKHIITLMESSSDDTKKSIFLVVDDTKLITGDYDEYYLGVYHNIVDSEDRYEHYLQYGTLDIIVGVFTYYKKYADGISCYKWMKSVIPKFVSQSSVVKGVDIGFEENTHAFELKSNLSKSELDGIYRQFVKWVTKVCPCQVEDES
jgi:hypothetical protein